MSKVFVGARLRRLREERGLTQAALAASLRISPSYLNQIEHNHRPLTVPVLLRVTAALGVDAQYFSDENEARLLADLGEAFTALPVEQAVSRSDLRAVAADLPAVGHALVALHRRYREAVERAEALASRIGEHGRSELAVIAPMPYEEVRDFFYAEHNHFPPLEEAAERLVAEADPELGDMGPGLAHRLETRHGVRIVLVNENDGGSNRSQRRYRAETRTLALPQHLKPGQRAFRMAEQLAFLEHGDLLAELSGTAGFSSEETRALSRIGLASYFAGAVLLPYLRFLERAEALHYDVDRLSRAFGVGFEPVCHRLSTMQRPDAPGVPFVFVRVDRAGNISKRQSATDFHFSRVGGTCPLWNVYEAFAQPGRILTQLAQMPDGRTYLWMARTVTTGAAGYRAPAKEFAVGLGCDVQHAPKLIYSKGLDLGDPNAPTPIGAGCKVCERVGCAQRAFPPIGRALAVDENDHPFAPYPVA